MDFDKKVIVDINGFIESGKQYDLDIKLPEDPRNVVYGVVKDSNGTPIEDAIIKLIEINKDERLPVSHTFSNKDGEFIFGPLCSKKSYAVQIWVDNVKHIKICDTCEKCGSCLKGEHISCKDSLNENSCLETCDEN